MVTVTLIDERGNIVLDSEMNPTTTTISDDHYQNMISEGKKPLWRAVSTDNKPKESREAEQLIEVAKTAEATEAKKGKK